MKKFKKFTPLLVLGLFVIGAYYMIVGMNNAVKMSSPKKTETISTNN